MAAPSSRVVLVDADVRLVAITGEKMLGGRRMSPWLSNSKPQKMPESRDPPTSSVDRSRRLEEEKGGGGSRSRKEKAAAAAEYRRPKSLLDWVWEGKVRVGTDDLVGAPDISTVSLHIAAVPRDMVTQLPRVPGAKVKSADEGLIVLSTGPRNLCHYYTSSGRFLVYDAAADALFLAPPIDCGFNADPETFGCRPVVMRTGEATGDFVLALLATSITGTRKYYLLTWSPAAWSSTSQQWMCKEVSLPDDVVQYPFIVDVAFASGNNGGGGRRLACWADLNWGVLTCDVLSADPKFQLQLLPEDLALDYAPMCLGRRDGHATMGRGVDGKIKFVYMDGFVDADLPKEQITIKTWTLVGQEVPDGLCDWVRDDHTTLSCGELWADESFLAIPGLPLQKCPPCLPVLSPNEQDVVYFFMSDFGDGNWHAKTTCDHVLGLNLRTKKVHTWSECPAGRTLRPVPSFIATEICLLSQESSNLDG